MIVGMASVDEAESEKKSSVGGEKEEGSQKLFRSEDILFGRFIREEIEQFPRISIIYTSQNQV